MKKLLLIVFLVAFGFAQLFADTTVGNTGNSGSVNPKQAATATLAKHHKKKHHRRRHRRHHRRRRHHKKKLAATPTTPTTPLTPSTAVK